MVTLLCMILWLVFTRFSSCIAFADLLNDGDMKLAVVDLGNGMNNIKLNVYKRNNTSKSIDSHRCPLFNLSLLYGLFSRTHSCFGCICGTLSVTFTRISSHFTSSNCPLLTVNQTELDAWNQVKEERIDLSALKDILSFPEVSGN